MLLVPEERDAGLQALKLETAAEKGRAGEERWHLQEGRDPLLRERGLHAHL